MKNSRILTEQETCRILAIALDLIYTHLISLKTYEEWIRIAVDYRIGSYEVL
jgi:hypothetical protein